MYTKEEAEGKRLRNPFDTITEGIGINRLTQNFMMAKLDGAFRGTDKEAVEMSRFVSSCLHFFQLISPWYKGFFQLPQCSRLTEHIPLNNFHYASFVVVKWAKTLLEFRGRLKYLDPLSSFRAKGTTFTPST